MESRIIHYFQAERYESLIFLAVGVSAIAAGIYFLVKMKGSFHTGFAIGLFAIALIQVAVGWTVYSRTPGQVAQIKMLYEQDKEALAAIEQPRMEEVMKNFRIYRWVELSIVLITLIIMLVAWFSSFWKGLAAGLFLQALIMLGLDYFAERRGEEYSEVIKEMSGV